MSESQRRSARSVTKPFVRPSHAERIEDWVRRLGTLTIGVLAFSASFEHVRDWTMQNSRPGTQEWRGYATAVVSELAIVVSGLIIKQKRRQKKSAWMTWIVLFVAMSFSLVAQLAMAKPSLSGFVVSAFPTVMFMVLVKAVTSATATAPAPAAENAAAVTSAPEKTVAKPQPKPVMSKPQPKAIEPKPEPEKVPLAVVHDQEPKKTPQAPTADSATKKKRWDSDELRQAVLELSDKTRKEQAEALGVSERRIRQVMEEPEAA